MALFKTQGSSAEVLLTDIPKNPYNIFSGTSILSSLDLLEIRPKGETAAAAAAAKLLQSCPTLCDPIDGSPPGSPVPGILQARTLEWVAISFSNAWKWKVKVKSLSHVQLLAIPWTAACQAPPSVGFSRQEYWTGVPWPSLKGETTWTDSLTRWKDLFWAPVQS